MDADAPGRGRPRGARTAVLAARPSLRAFGGAGLAAWLDGWRRRLGDALALEAERRRLFLWLPVAMGAGILLYFAADREPALWAPAAGFALSSALFVLLRRRRIAPLLCLGAAAAFAGFATASWRTTSVGSPILAAPRIGQVSGFVESVEARDAGARIVLLTTGMAGVEPERRPRRVRVSIRSGSISPGAHVSATARLLPPPGPAQPGGYDFGRDAFFRGIGAVGSIAGRITLTPAPVSPPAGIVWAATIDGARNALTQRIAEAGGGQAGAMAAALVTGKRGLITETTNADLRAAGIYHIVTIDAVF